MMIFNGFPIEYALMTACVGCGVILACHYLKMRQKPVVVPTILFWQQAMNSHKRNTLFGPFSSFLTLCFLLLVALILVFAMLLPIMTPLKKAVLVIDTSSATDLSRAQNHAWSLIRQNDRCGVIAVGREVHTCAAFTSTRQTALAAVNRISADSSPYSALQQAIKEARAAAASAQVIVLTGQRLDEPEQIQVVACPADNPLGDVVPLKVFFPEEMRLPGQAYCHADNRFEYCPDIHDADLRLDDVDADLFEDWQEPGFVEDLSDILERRAGLKYRTSVLSISGDVDQKTSFFAFRWGLDKTVILVVLVFLCMEGILVRKGRMV